MPAYTRARMRLVSLVLLTALGSTGTALAQTVTSEDTVRSGRRMLERFPYYEVVAYTVFRVDGDIVHLAGYSVEGRLARDAEAAAKRASGVTDVANTTEMLPT